MAGRLRGRALRLMRQLDAGTGYRSEIERELQARLGSAAAVTSPASAPSAADETAAPADPSSPVDSICAACETVNDADARFCKGCGVKMKS